MFLKILEVSNNNGSLDEATVRRGTIFKLTFEVQPAFIS